MIPFNKKTDSKQITIPEYFRIDPSLSESLKNFIQDLKLDRTFTVGENGKSRVSLVVIDLTKKNPLFGGVNNNDFVYPAGISKVFVAAKVLQQISRGRYSLMTQQVVINPNTMDSIKSVSTDPRRLLRDGDTVTVDYLLDLMLTRDDNSAANCLIDLAGRNNINQIIHDNGWTGSEVTRKYLDRIYEDPDYKDVFSTMTCALHTADFMYKVYTNQLVNPWVSMQLKTLLGRQKDVTKLTAGLPRNVMFYHMTGYCPYWTNDVGIIDNGSVRYIISCFLPMPEQEANPNLEKLSNRIYHLIKDRVS